MTILIVFVALVNIIAFLVPKRKTKIELFTVGMFAILFAVLTDVYLSLKYHLYWYFKPEANWRWLITLFGLKAQMGLLFINYFPLLSGFLRKVVYVLLWSVFSVAFEWVIVYVADVLHYQGWNIWYTVMAYPIILTTIVLCFYLVRHLIRDNRWF